MANSFNRKLLAEVFKEPRMLRDFEEFTESVNSGLPALVADAQNAADTAQTQATAAQGTANAAASAASAAQATANTALAKEMAATIQSNTSSYFIANTRGYIVSLCSAVSGVINVTLPNATGCAGMIVCVKKVDASVNSVDIYPTGIQLIDGALSKTLLAQYNRITVVSDGVGWQVIA